MPSPGSGRTATWRETATVTGWRRRLVAALLFAGGLGIAWVLFESIDRDALFAAFERGGWALVLVLFYRFLPLTADSVGWRLLLPAGASASLPLLVVFRWIGESINNLLPVAQVGGAVVRARLLTRTGVCGAAAGASVLADFVVGLVAQVLFTVAGLAALFALIGWSSELGDITAAVALGAALIAVFVGLQGRGMFGRIAGWIERLAPRGGFGAGEGLAAVERHLQETYGRQGAVAGCTAWRLGGWCLHAGEVWLILNLMGYPIGIAEALAIESLGSAARSAAFAVPAAAGVQEAGIVGVGLMLGLPAEAGLALALMRRAREVLTSLPGLAVWPLLERRGAARRPA